MMWRLPTSLHLLVAALIAMSSQLPIDPNNSYYLEFTSRMRNPIPLEMANNSFDDHYQGCAHEMETEIHGLLEQEFKKSHILQQGWKTAEEIWNQTKEYYHHDLKDIYAVAIIAYTMQEINLYGLFNTATRTAGRSHEDYEKYPYKALHFLLTHAATLLKEWERQVVYRGVGLEFSARVGEVVRFGQFTSTSLNKTVALEFAEKTLFTIKHTRYGYPVAKLSEYPDEEEILIPPHEMFRVLSISIDEGDLKVITLRSSGSCSNWNCALLNDGKNTQSCPKHQVLVF